MIIHNSGVTYEPHCYIALSAWYMWTTTHMLKILNSSIQNLVATDLCTPSVAVNTNTTHVRHAHTLSEQSHSHVCTNTRQLPSALPRSKIASTCYQNNKWYTIWVSVCCLQRAIHTGHWGPLISTVHYSYLQLLPCLWEQWPCWLDSLWLNLQRWVAE
jgi:hypothetical protein